MHIVSPDSFQYTPLKYTKQHKLSSWCFDVITCSTHLTPPAWTYRTHWPHSHIEWPWVAVVCNKTVIFSFIPYQVTGLRRHVSPGTGNSRKHSWTKQTTENRGKPCEGKEFLSPMQVIVHSFLWNRQTFVCPLLSDQHDVTSISTEAETEYCQAQRGLVASLISSHVSFLNLFFVSCKGHENKIIWWPRVLLTF